MVSSGLNVGVNNLKLKLTVGFRIIKHKNKKQDPRPLKEVRDLNDVRGWLLSWVVLCLTQPTKKGYLMGNLANNSSRDN